MSSCLKTTLKGVVDDDSLPRFGDITLINTKEYASDPICDRGPGFGIQANGAISLKAVDGEFLSTTDLSPLGSEITITPTALTLVCVSKETTKVVIHDTNYNTLTSLVTEGREGIGNAGGHMNGVFEFANLAELRARRGLWRLVFCAPTLRYVDDFSKLASIPSLRYVAYDDYDLTKHRTTKEVGALTQLTQLTLGRCTLDGDFADLQGMTSLAGIYYTASQGELNADLSVLPPQNVRIYVANVTTGGKMTQFTWKTTRASSASPITLEGAAHMGDYIDAMLNNIVNCNGPMINGKVLRLVGTRTSASDAAVATLQSNGWTITVTPES